MRTKLIQIIDNVSMPWSERRILNQSDSSWPAVHASHLFTAETAAVKLWGTLVICAGCSSNSERSLSRLHSYRAILILLTVFPNLHLHSSKLTHKLHIFHLNTYSQSMRSNGTISLLVRLCRLCETERTFTASNDETQSQTLFPPRFDAMLVRAAGEVV